MKKKTPLYDSHVRLGARMVDFHGFLMPVQYTGIIDEHLCVRNGAGIFDLSHMGEVEVKGKEALPYIQNLATNDAGRLAVGQALYTPICNELGGILDDVIVYRTGEERFIIALNCANIAKDLEWMEKHAGQGGVEIVDNSDGMALIAIQGPLSESILREATTDDITQLKSFHISEVTLNHTQALISRTGYTGEDGFEIFLPTGHAEEVWDLLLAVGREKGLKPVGLGARDTLRLEACLPLYGNDIDAATSPLEAGIGWAVRFDKGGFIGKEALSAQRTNGVDRKLVGFEMLDRGIPRTGCHITMGEGNGSPANQIGKVTSGTYSPSTRKNIGLGYVDADYSGIGTFIGVSIRDRIYKAVIVKTPFYKR